MRIGTIVKVKDIHYNQGSETIVIGSRATIVDGEKELPTEYENFIKYMKTIDPVDYKETIKEFVFVKWDKNDINYNNASDGVYALYRFEAIGEQQNYSTAQNVTNSLYCCCSGPEKIIPIMGINVRVCVQCKKEKI